MKKRLSIQWQLIVFIIMPLVAILFSVTIFNYFKNLNTFRENQAKEKQLIINEVEAITSFYDKALELHEESYSARMQKVAESLPELFSSEEAPCAANLQSVLKKSGMDSLTEFIYVVNPDYVICNTTFKKDLGLDFKKFGKSFIKFFEEIKQNKKFKCDRFGLEMSTRRIKKWGYLPLPSNGYLIELGFDSRQANELMKTLYDKSSDISRQHPEFRKINLDACIKDLKSFVLDSAYYNLYNRALKEKRTISVIREVNGTNITDEFIFIEMKGAALYDGYILHIQSDNSKENLLLHEQLINMLWWIIGLSAVVVVLLLLVVKKIITPVIKLSRKTQIISEGNLNERIEVDGSKELAELSENFNVMVERLKESYEGLEQKVKERTAEVVHQKKLIEEKHKEITDSINYAERIQKSFLATKAHLDENLKEYFTFFKPKDVVSGDFYWSATLNNGNFILCTADSTGHGVPGAIMSLLNITSLEKAIERHNEPAEILNTTRKIIIERLKKDGSLEGGKDGMDASLCVYDFKKMELFVSAAHNPVWIVRGEEVIEIKPDKMPVGKHDRQDESFTQQVISLQKGDVVYTLTDGFPDQFGGEKGKKFMSKNLREMLKSNAKLPLIEQRKLLEETFNAWRGALEQIDDVSVIGVRI